MKKWQCTVCGYIHVGEEPPETCPVCGADRSMFVELVESKEDSSIMDDLQKQSPLPPPSPGSRPRGYLEIINNLMVKHHLHPISVHIPNGMVPAVVLFMLLALLFHSKRLDAAAFYNTLFVVLSLPVVLYTGFNEWRKKYKAKLTRIFITKIIAAGVVTASAILIVILRAAIPDILQTPSAIRIGYILLHFIMLVATAVAGYIGGKLVFKD